MHVIGSSNPHQEEILRLTRMLPNAECHIQVNNMAELMAIADLAVGAGGSTTWERCYLSLPAVVVTVAENQVNGTKILSKAGLVYFLGKHKNIFPEDYTRAILHFNKDRSLYQKISQAGLDLVDYLGVERVVEAMLNLSYLSLKN